MSTSTIDARGCLSCRSNITGVWRIKAWDVGILGGVTLRYEPSELFSDIAKRQEFGAVIDDAGEWFATMSEAIMERDSLIAYAKELY